MAEPRPYAEALNRLRGVGLRPTRQRLALARLLLDAPRRHVTAEGLHAEAQRAGVKVSLATVYNTLHQFTAAGLLREVVVDSARTYFDTNRDAHHHFFREDTGELIDIPDSDVDLSRLPAAPGGTRVERVDVVIRLRPDRVGS